jgi:hypothetical protein
MDKMVLTLVVVGGLMHLQMHDDNRWADFVDLKGYADDCPRGP